MKPFKVIAMRVILFSRADWFQKWVSKTREMGRRPLERLNGARGTRVMLVDRRGGDLCLCHKNPLCLVVGGRIIGRTIQPARDIYRG